MRFTVNCAFEGCDDVISSFNTTLPNPAKSIVVFGGGNAVISVPATIRFTTLEPASLDCRVPLLLLVVLTAVISCAVIRSDSTLTLWMSDVAVAMFSALDALDKGESLRKAVSASSTSRQPRGVSPPSGSARSASSIRAAASSREVVADAPGKSGASLERLQIGDSSYVLKHLSLADDWTMRASGSLRGAPLELWERGILARLPDWKPGTRRLERYPY